MPERPLLILPSPALPVERTRKKIFPGKFFRPGHERQVERISPIFKAIQEDFDALGARLKAEAAGVTPEKVLVLEIVGAVEDFFVAVRKIEGMEWLGEIEEEDIPPDDDFFALDSQGRPKPEKSLRGQLFLVFSNQQALNRLLSFWGRWQEGKPLPHGFGKWNQVFSHLRDIHPWGVKERLIETGVLEDWRERVEHKEEVLPCEVELWFRHNRVVRTAARGRVLNLVTAEKGRVLGEAIIEDIAYHGLLIELPVASISKLIDGPRDDIGIVNCEQIQFFRASGQMAGILPDDQRIPDNIHIPKSEVISDPVAALLDGFPLQEHIYLSDRLVVDDPDNIETIYQAHERRHGTAMASLIIHGDLDSDELPLQRKLYVRPILQPDRRDWRRTREETVPENILVVDLIHRAVRRIFDGDGGEPATAPNVSIINLSIGIKDRLFYAALSPLARLLDWLSWKYKVLFIVSAGNHSNPLELAMRWGGFRALEPHERQARVIKAIAADSRNRRLLSPAEAINVLTVGALHNDHSGDYNLPQTVDPYVDEGLPSLINAQGMGYRRAIKPEIFSPGGRVILQEPLVANHNETCVIYDRPLSPGQRVAAPGSIPGEIGGTWFIRGTSNAAALTTRAGTILYEVLQELRSEPGGELIDMVPISIWLKSLLTHAAEWGTAGDVLRSVLLSPENSRQFKEYITRLLGYGGVQPIRVRECAEHRVTALSGGSLRNGQAHVHRFPLPPSLSGQRYWRRLTITLAWFSPVNATHQKWRKAALWFEPQKDLLNVDRQQANWQAVRRGTLQHEVLEGEKASAFVDGSTLEIKVNCTEDAGVLEDSIPYALAMTLEVKEDIGIPIYDEVRVRVHAARVKVASA